MFTIVAPHPWLVVGDRWLVVGGRWLVVGGRWLVVGGQLSVASDVGEVNKGVVDHKRALTAAPQPIH